MIWLENRRRLRTVNPHAGHRLSQRLDPHVLGKEELIEPCECRVGLCRRHVEQEHRGRLKHMHVGEHPALGRQPGRVASGALGQRLNVVGQQPLQVRGSIGTGHSNLCARRNRPDSGACAHRRLVRRVRHGTVRIQGRCGPTCGFSIVRAHFC